MKELQKRYTIENLYQLKLDAIQSIEELKNVDDKLRSNLQSIKGYPPYRFDWRFENHGENREEKYFDRIIWRYFINLCHLEKYMLCTEYEKMIKEIEEFRTPEFTPTNAEGWLLNLKKLIYENVRLMCKRVYDKLINGHYYTGSGYNAPKKKRNNSGVDKRFILRTNDYSRIFGYWYNEPTITDDLEKVCYLLGGETLPEDTIITKAKKDKICEVNCNYFSVKFCKNGNTHYLMNDNIRDKLNLIGPDGNILGESIKIKILDII